MSDQPHMLSAKTCPVCHANFSSIEFNAYYDHVRDCHPQLKEYTIGKRCHHACTHVPCIIFRGVEAQFCDKCTAPLGRRATYVPKAGKLYHAACITKTEGT
jgi:hypothetical protein